MIKIQVYLINCSSTIRYTCTLFVLSITEKQFYFHMHLFDLIEICSTEDDYTKYVLICYYF